MFSLQMNKCERQEKMCHKSQKRLSFLADKIIKTWEKLKEREWERARENPKLYYKIKVAVEVLCNSSVFAED